MEHSKSTDSQALAELIDSHCHLNYDYSPKNQAEIVQEALDEGVSTLITIGTDLPSLPEIQKLSEQFSNVYHTVGIHPHDVAAISDSDLVLVEEFAKHPKCRAIGEIGLDYHYDHSPRPIQLARLEQQLALALKLNLPIVIHSREGEADLLSALKNYTAQISKTSRKGNEAIPGVIHCFSGSLEFGKACLDLGFFISFSGILTFKKADEIREAAQQFPLERILIETDSPFLAPIPMRGKKCEPKMVKINAQKLAEVKNLPFEVIARATTENAKRVFRLS